MGQNVRASEFAAARPTGALRLLWGAAGTLLAVLYTAVLSVPAAVAAALGAPRIVTRISTLWGRLIIGTCGIKVEFVGLENLAGLKSYVIAANHQSFFDIFAFLAYLPGEVRLVAKKELMKIPLLGYAMSHAGHIVVDRQAGGAAIRRAIEVARRGYCIAVFAEGRRYSDNRVHEFQDGAAWLAIAAKVPAVPVAISGSSAFFPRRAKVVVPGGRMRIAIGKPIETAGLRSADRAGLTHQLEEAVRANFVSRL